MPYRKHEGGAPSEAVDEGIVGELVQQFADPYAFYRELVQNAIDAGTAAVRVLIRPRAGGGVRVSVRDEGEGMDPEILEDRLLVLFRSGKEGRTDAIGKFGVGFVSVLALEPERVTVSTQRAEGPRYTLHLFADHRYELFESARRGAGSGTTVSLDLPAMDPDELVERSLASLRAWCRHAAVPIHLRVAPLDDDDEEEEDGDGDGDGVRDYRIDEPLALPACLAQIDVTLGTTRIVLGIPSEISSYAGFFNHGLTLHETSTVERDLLPQLGLHLKVQDKRLEHTLSRDNVRRDAAFFDVLGRVREAYVTHLLPQVLVAMRQALVQSEHDVYGALFGRAMHPSAPLPIPQRDLPVKLLHPVEGRDVLRVSELRRGVTATPKAAALTRALAERGHHVVDARYGGGLAGGSARYAELLGLAETHASYTLVEPIEATGSDLALQEALLAALGKALRAPDGVQWVRFSGAHRGWSAGAKVDDKPWVTTGTLDANPFRRLRRPGLLLAVSTLRRARELAKSDPALAGALLARKVLLTHGELDEDADLDLTTHALTELLGVEP